MLLVEEYKSVYPIGNFFIRQMFPYEKLPRELQMLILEFIRRQSYTDKSYFHLRLVCKDWHRFIPLSKVYHDIIIKKVRSDQLDICKQVPYRRINVFLCDERGQLGCYKLFEKKNPHAIHTSTLFYSILYWCNK